MKTHSLLITQLLAAALALPANAATSTLLGWNNLGMHCMDSDYSVFSILPPYNTIEAQLVVNGRLITNTTGYSVTYQAVADPFGSINRTSVGKGNWLQYAPQLFGAVAADQGLPFPNTNISFWMPGVNNTPQTMLFEQADEPAGGVFTPVNWFHAYGIPITPYDDAGNKNPYPMMRQIAWAGATPIATNDIVLPVSDEMDCRACHASGTSAAAKPGGGWVWDGAQERDFRLNILRLHDERNFASHATVYRAALAEKKFNPQGLYRGVVADGKPVLCAACHASEALGGGGIAGIPPLTTSVHGLHAQVEDPISLGTLNSAANRAACYRCHPGSTTRCLRGAMGGAIAADGSMEMQCQSCHGNMSTVGSPNRTGWFMEPNCGQCHVSATNQNHIIRYTSVFTDTQAWTPRTNQDRTFATSANTPPTPWNLSLYRFSVGHGGLQCSACHGSTHAEFPSTHVNDNVRNVNLQGHAGVMVECTKCHTSMSVNSVTAAGGPHGMHPIGPSWVSGHHDYINDLAKCQACHGADNRGTELSRAQDQRTLTVRFETRTNTLSLFRGAIVGCYTCHNGAGDDSVNNSVAPTATAVSGDTDNATPLNLPSTLTPGTATLRVISQPANGSLGVSGNVLTYFPNAGFVGTDTFTYAAWDGSKNSLLVTGSVTVAQGAFTIGAVAHVPTDYPAGWSVPFGVVPAVTNNLGAVTFNWDFGDGSPNSTNQFPTHAYAYPGAYSWTVVATVSSRSVTNRGTILIGTPVLPVLSAEGSLIQIQWPATAADVVLEQTDALGPAAVWTPVADAIDYSAGNSIITLSGSGQKFFRLRRAW